MKYIDVRDTIREGDLLAFSGRSWFSKLIQRFTRSVISHVGLAIRIKNRLYVIEAMERKGLRLYPLSRYIKAGSIVEWWELLDGSYGVDRTKTITFAMDHVGSPYGMWQLIKDFILRTGGQKEKFYCSLYVLESLRAGGYVGEGFDDQNPSPGEVTRLPCFHRKGYLQQ